jgi:hypothetical protein
MCEMNYLNMKKSNFEKKKNDFSSEVKVFLTVVPF